MKTSCGHHVSRQRDTIKTRTPFQRSITTRTLIGVLIIALSAAGKVRGESQADNQNAFTKVDPPTLYADRAALGTLPTATIVIDNSLLPTDYVNATNVAGEIWSYLINSSQPIRILIRRSSLQEGKLASTSPWSMERVAGHAEKFPTAAAEMLTGSNLNGNNADMIVTLNTRCDADWYFGVDGNTPPNKRDLLTVVLHEIAHGLGFLTSFRIDSTQQGTRDSVCFIYDKFCSKESHYPSQNSNVLINFTYPSSALSQAITNDTLYFSGEKSWAMGNQSTPKLYAPPFFAAGSSVCHLDESRYQAGNRNSLMSPNLSYAEAVHSPGELALGILADLNWQVNRMVSFTRPFAGAFTYPDSSIQAEWYFTDQFSTTVSVALWKKNAWGTFEENRQLGTTISYPGQNSAFLHIPANLDTGWYKIVFSIGAQRLGMSHGFAVLPPSPTGGQVERVVLYPPGNTYYGQISVEARTTTQGATIHYDTTGGEPTENSPVYPEGGLELPTSRTIRAKAFKPPLYVPSEVTVEQYTISTTLGVPTGPIRPTKPNPVRFADGTYGRTSTSFPYVGRNATIFLPPRTCVARAFLQWSNLPAYIHPDSITMATLLISRYSQSGTLTVSLSRTMGNALDDSVLWNSPATGVSIESSVSFGFEPFQRSYYPGSAFVDQLKHGLQLDRSLQIAVVSNSESQDVWLQIEDATLTIVYKAKTLRIAQIDSGGFSFGAWAKWESNQWRYHPDSILIRPTNTRHDTLLANQEYKPGTFQKYNRWTVNDGPDSIVNHSTIRMTANTSSVLAQFKPSNPATIRTQLVEGGATGGTLNFRDPWLVDNSDAKGPKNRGTAAIWHNVASPFKPESSATYKGVFLNESGPPFWNPPYYSVGAPNPNTFTINGNNYSAYFRNWEGSSVQYQNADAAQTGVVFTSSGATATANYKLHHASSSPEAMAFNTQRKITRDSLGYWHKVYQSADLIWYTRSLNTSGTSWAPEVLLSSSLLPPDWLHRDPSVIFVPSAISPGQEQGSEATEATFQPARVRVVWETYTSDASNHEITVCEINPVTGGILYGPATLHNWEGQGQRARPVLGVAREGDRSILPHRFSRLLPGFSRAWMRFGAACGCQTIRRLG